MVKLIHTNADLSVQVHPDDEYARRVENQFGKTECWYFADEPKNPIVLGHTANSKEDISTAIKEGKLEELLKKVAVKKDDFVLINAKTIHALTSGLLVVEIQQSSDVTYRLYDYGRLQNGKPRELHIEKSIDVIGCPHQDNTGMDEVTKVADAEVKTMVTCPYYTVKKILVKGEAELTKDGAYQLFSVIDGEGTLDGVAVKKGDHFILPTGYDTFKLAGNMELMTSYTAEAVNE